MSDALALGLAMALLFVPALAIATRPWWRTGSARMRRQRANVAAYRTRLAELEAEQAAGLIEAAEGAALQQELAARLLADTEPLTATAEPMIATATRRRAWPILLAGLLLAAFAGTGYWLDGSWRVQQQIAHRAVADPAVLAMVQKLADTLAQKPEDAAGWALLGRSYFALQRFDDAAKAYAQANSHAAAQNPDWLTDEGEALGLADARNLESRAAPLFEQALKLDAESGKALWYAGLIAAQAGDAPRARLHWTRLAKQDLPPAMRAVLQSQLAALDGASADASAASSATSADSAAAASAVTLHLHVSLADGLASKIPPAATLLVFAKAADGPPTTSPAVQGMPLAVQRVAGAKLPLDVTLDDSQAMMPAMRLSQFDRYVLTARLSRGGMAQAVSGDLQGSVKASRADAGKTLALTIDSLVP